MKPDTEYFEFQQIFDSFDMAVIVMDMDGIVEYFFREMKEILSNNYQPTMVERKKCYELCQDIWSEAGNRFCSWCGINDVINKGKTVKKFVKGADKTHWFFSWAPIRNQAHKITKIVKTVTDITDQIEEKKYLGNKLMDIFSKMRIGIMILDDKGKIIFLNGAMEKRWGLGFNEVAYTYFPELEIYDNNSAFNRAFDNACRGIRSNEIEMEMKRYDGQSFQVSIDLIPFKKDNENWQVIMLEQDITKLFNEKELVKNDLKKKEAKLVELDKLAAIGQLAAGIAHELNTPTTYVRGNMQTFGKYTKIIADLVNRLQDDIPVSERNAVLDRMEKLITNMKEIAQSSFNGTSRIMKIISSMKSFVHTRNNMPILINIYAPLQDALILVFNRIKYKGSVFVNEMKITNDINLIDIFPSISILGSESRLSQLFIILFNNSIDAWESKSDKKKDPLRIDINVSVKKNAVKIEIKDNAFGFPDAIKDKIFEPFYTTKSKTGGTGLGLSIARQIAAEHNTVLMADNMPGKGVNFKMKIRIHKKT